MIEQMRGERMAQHVRGELFAVDPRQHGIVFNPVPEGLARHLLGALTGK